MDFSFDTKLANAGLVDVAVQNTGSTYAAANPKRIAPGSKGTSMVYARLSNLGAGHMPPLGVSILDSAAITLIGRWIDERRAAGEAGVVSCSGLKRKYRDLLRHDRPEVRLVFLDGSRELRGRLSNRR